MDFHFATAFELIADTVPNEPALISGGVTRTWANSMNAPRVAGVLNAHGLTANSKVGIYLHNSNEYAEIHHGVFKTRLPDQHELPLQGGRVDLSARQRRCRGGRLFNRHTRCAFGKFGKSCRRSNCGCRWTTALSRCCTVRSITNVRCAQRTGTAHSAAW